MFLDILLHLHPELSSVILCFSIIDTQLQAMKETRITTNLLISLVLLLPFWNYVLNFMSWSCSILPFKSHSSFVTVQTVKDVWRICGTPGVSVWAQMSPPTSPTRTSSMRRRQSHVCFDTTALDTIIEPLVRCTQHFMGCFMNSHQNFISSRYR